MKNSVGDKAPAAAKTTRKTATPAPSAKAPAKSKNAEIAETRVETVELSVATSAIESTPSIAPDTMDFTHIGFERVAQRAFELWKQAGGTHGHHVDDWLRAEEQLLKEQSKSTTLRSK